MTTESVIQEKIKHDSHESIKLYEVEFIELIRRRLGILADKQKHELYQTISDACDKFNCEPKDYLALLANCSNDSPLLEHLIIGITIGETYFFRDKNQMKLLQEMILPDLIKRKREENKLVLRVWSAGSSSGEEIYTIAIMLTELLPDIKNWTLNLLGTDINIKGLQKALNGEYTQWSMRSITDYFKHRYFTQQDKKFILIPQIKNLVDFKFLNLNDDVYPSIFNGTNAQDLIICRNVLIYFDSDRISHLMHKFSKSLMPNGFLMLGASDPVDLNENKTDLVFHYRKGTLFSLASREPQDKVKESAALAAPRVYKEIKQVYSLEQEHVAKSPTSLINKIEHAFEYENNITKLLNCAEWQPALNLIEKYETSVGKTVFILNAKANALANLGKLNEAIELFKQCISNDPTNKDTYFMYALALSELNKFAECEAALRKTLFLDREFVPGHFQLGLLLIKNQRHDAGVKSLKNALMIAQTKQPHLSIPGSQGLDYGRLAEILKKEINLYTHTEK